MRLLSSGQKSFEFCTHNFFQNQHFFRPKYFSNSKLFLILNLLDPTSLTFLAAMSSSRSDGVTQFVLPFVLPFITLFSFSVFGVCITFGCFKEVKGCFKKVLRMFKGSFKGVLRKFQGIFNEVPSVFQGRLKGVPRDL